MGAAQLDRLLPWIAGSLLLLALIAVAAGQVPDIECGGEGDVDQGAAADVLVVVTVLATTLAVGGSLYRLVVMAGDGLYRRRDGWILGLCVAGLAVAALIGALENTVAAGLAIGVLVITGLALLALLVAAIRGERIDDVGLLLPIYLFGAACIYVVSGGVALLAKSGIGC